MFMNPTERAEPGEYIAKLEALLGRCSWLFVRMMYLQMMHFGWGIPLEIFSSLKIGKGLQDSVPAFGINKETLQLSKRFYEPKKLPGKHFAIQNLNLKSNQIEPDWLANLESFERLIAFLIILANCDIQMAVNKGK